MQDKICLDPETSTKPSEPEELYYDQFQPDAGYESDRALRDMYARMRRRSAIFLWIVLLLMLIAVAIIWLSGVAEQSGNETGRGMQLAFLIGHSMIL